MNQWRGRKYKKGRRCLLRRRKMYVVDKKLIKQYFKEKDVKFMIKEIKGNTKLEHYGDSFIVRIPDNIIDFLVLENNQKFLISTQGESIVLTPEVK